MSLAGLVVMVEWLVGLVVLVALLQEVLFVVVVVVVVVKLVVVEHQVLKFRQTNILEYFQSQYFFASTVYFGKFCVALTKELIYERNMRND